ncbi:hypothetical protein AAL_02060 [Moelleriella libera RCEF 2490]|uniref:Uncharacterized protein n=1 Tax=Moelleriella libera RCEF 2490 TaxID=1081109 RepID=A0A168F583_9HYPO|nr:hypothetical protein AAL_02060 [Moelleriella libera RCEF 2490]
MGRLVLQTQDHQPMRCDLYPDTLGTTLGVPEPFYFLPPQTFRHQSLPRLSGQNTTEVSSLILEPVLGEVLVAYRRIGHCTVTDAVDVSILGLRADENGWANGWGEPDDEEIAII